ncbi:VOC family protein [Paracraurococcus ruber]|nr:VOC family protein [Paracraurococcus ruber]
MAATREEPILGLDHAVVAVPDLDAARAAHATLFDLPMVADGGGQASLALANIDLLLVAGDGPPALAALALAVRDKAAALTLLARRGLPAAGPAAPGPFGDTVPLAPQAARGLHLRLADPAPRRGGTAIRLDHLVIRSGDPERTTALLAGRLGLELRLDRSNPDWGTRLLFFRCGDTVLEVSHDLAAGITDAPDSLWGMTWRVPDVAAAHARLAAAGMPVSPLRVGRKPGTRLFTIRDGAAGIPTAMIGA